MQLSKRLQAVADLVTPGSIVADVGCDHAYTAIYLIKNNLSPYVIAMDVNQGPLNKAKENIRRYGIEEGRIDIRRSNGLEKLKEEEADTILIAGMGGALINQILFSHKEVTTSVKELVLQPQSELSLVRSMLQDNGFVITKENMIKEDGKFYVMMRAQAKTEHMSLDTYQLRTDEELYYGRLLIQARHPILREYLEWEHNLCNQILISLQQEVTDNTIKRRLELMEKIQRIENTLNYYEEEEIG